MGFLAAGGVQGGMSYGIANHFTMLFSHQIMRQWVPENIFRVLNYYSWLSTAGWNNQDSSPFYNFLLGTKSHFIKNLKLNIKSTVQALTFATLQKSQLTAANQIQKEENSHFSIHAKQANHRVPEIIVRTTCFKNRLPFSMSESHAH